MPTTIDQPDPSARISRPSRMRRVGRWATRGFAVIGLGLTVYLAAATVADVSVFDQTSGGYAPPYEGWTGPPIDWTIVDVSPTGFVRRGRVLDVLVDCTTGKITMDMLGVTIPFRGFSDRALAVHKPREACLAAGFMPAF